MRAGLICLIHLHLATETFAENVFKNVVGDRGHLTLLQGSNLGLSQKDRSAGIPIASLTQRLYAA
jgi:hypothetical protein